ncbi:MAG TPA: outer membrane beta-barrel protein, partial [Bacteroidia bacterium]|nr:outer membrane beta-barrel protein [Bacteroidia bacterium]
ETQGLYVSGATGSAINDAATVRLGGRSKLDSNLYYRLYAQHFDQNGTQLQNGQSAKDAWDMVQGGFRMDYEPSKANTLTLQGDFYGGTSNKDSLIEKAVTDGQNVLARYTHVFSDHSELKIQAYYDRTLRNTPDATLPFIYSLNTYDLDIQHRFGLGKKHSILYGIGYRMQEDRTARLFVPQNRDMRVCTAFIQDEIALSPNLLKLTLGSKFLDNDFTGFEFEPCARLAWTPNAKNTLWTSVSRAVRTPTRFDSDIIPTDVKFVSEKVVAYELGYHYNPSKDLTFSAATYYNHYNDLRSLDLAMLPSPHTIIQNNQRAESWGAEFNANFRVSSTWRIRGGYTYFDRNIWAVSPAVFTASPAFESIDPRNIFMLQSMLDLGKHLSFDLVGRYVDVLPATVVTTGVPSYYTCDIRLAWKQKAVEVSLAGQNLLEANHAETSTYQIPRTFYIKLVCRL